MSGSQYNCALHPSIPITHFCESCKDLVCKACIEKQPHCGATHQIKTLEQSANIRRNYYLHYITTEVNPMRERVDERLSLISQLKEEALDNKRVIEKDINIEFEGISDRLNDKLEEKIIKRQTDVKHLEYFVQSLDDLNQTFDSIYQNPHAFLVVYKTLDIEINKLESIESNILSAQETDNTPLPREFLETQQKVATLPQYEQKANFMNQLIQKTIKHWKAEIEKAKKNTVVKQKSIKQSYNEILEKMAKSQIAKVCVFCGHPFTIENVNETCSNNRTFKINSVYKTVEWEKIIPEDVRGSKRHFWFRSDSVHRKKPDLEEHALLRKHSKKHYLNSLLELEAVKFRLNNYEIENGKTFKQMIAGNDPQRSGYISKIAFNYVLSKTYSISKVQIDSLVGYLLEQKGINVDRFLNLLANPTQQYNKFVSEQEQMQKAKPVAPVSIGSKFRY